MQHVLSHCTYYVQFRLNIRLIGDHVAPSLDLTAAAYLSTSKKNIFMQGSSRDRLSRADTSRGFCLFCFLHVPVIRASSSSFTLYLTLRGRNERKDELSEKYREYVRLINVRGRPNVGEMLKTFAPSRDSSKMA